MSANSIDRRKFLVAAAGAGLFAPAILTATRVDAAGVSKMAGQLLLTGIPGNSPDDRSVKALAAHMKAGRVGGSVLLRHNFKSRKNVIGMTKLFFGADGNTLNAVDQEGGKVQRLSPKFGFKKIPEANWVARNLSPAKAKALYASAGREMKKAGFNLNLAPSVDFHDPKNPVIGKYGRSFGTEAGKIAAYAGAFVDGMSSTGVACSLKHFPGHGTSRGDSHDGFVDISKTWDDDELKPFKLLAAKAPLVMGGHLFHPTFSDGKMPVTFSKKALKGMLRKKLGYRGVILTDDLDMGAIRKSFSLKQACILSLQAGNDMLLLSNSLGYDEDMPVKVGRWITGAVKSGQLSSKQIQASYNRVMRMKARI